MIAMEQSCPGVYCGRIKFENDTFSDCGPCPLGYRSSNIYIKSNNSECIKCTDSLELYDYLFLIFIFISQLTFEFYFIDKCIKRSILTFETITLYICASLEIILSVVLSLFIYAYDYPNYKITTCRSYTLMDWYPVLFEDPTMKGKHQLKCSREIVYPLYSLPFCYLFLTFVFLLLIRPFVIQKFKIIDGMVTIHLTLYLIPAIGAIHFVFAGIIYYFWPYILIISSVISISIHFAYKLDQRCLSLFREMLTNRRSLTIVLLHMFLHSIALVAIIETKKLNYFLLLITPIPGFFYILTSQFTHPHRFI